MTELERKVKELGKEDFTPIAKILIKMIEELQQDWIASQEFIKTLTEKLQQDKEQILILKNMLLLHSAGLDTKYWMKRLEADSPTESSTS